MRYNIKYAGGSVGDDWESETQIEADNWIDVAREAEKMERPQQHAHEEDLGVWVTAIEIILPNESATAPPRAGCMT